MKLLPLLLIAVLPLCAQETRREIVNPSKAPADDAKPNSTAVPDGYAIHSHFERVVILRFKYDTDLLAGIQKMVKQENIRNAVILSAAGSVRGYQVHKFRTGRFLPKIHL